MRVIFMVPLTGEIVCESALGEGPWGAVYPIRWNANRMKN